MTVKNKKQLYFIFLTSSLLISGIITFFIKYNILPYEFRLDEKIPSYNITNINIYNDLDYDGISEKINFGVISGTINYYLIVFNENNKNIAELHFRGLNNYRWVMFEDYNNDNFKEIFAFSVSHDTLFLTILNIKTNKFILNNQYILEKPDSALKDFWDIEVRPIALINSNKLKTKELIFYVRGNVTIYPRTVYSYDIENKKIINRFVTGSRLSQTEMFDVTNDGNKEIIISTEVLGNVKKKFGYHDRTGWLFVLDKNLKPLFAPKSFGSFPGDNHVIHFKKDNHSYFYILYYNNTDSGKLVQSLLLNQKGQELPHNNSFNFDYRLPLKVTENNKDFIYIAKDNGELFKLDDKLQVVKRNTIKAQNIDFISEIIFGKQNKKALLLRCSKHICLVDNELNLLASREINEMFWRIGVNFEKLNGASKLPQLPIFTAKNNYLFTIIDNKVLYYLLFLFLIISFFIFLISYLTHKVLTFFSIYTNYFNYSLNKSAKGVAILDYNGNIYYTNQNIKTYFNLITPIEKGAEYKTVFQNYSSIILNIEKSILTAEKITQEIQISTHEYQFEGLINVIPFTSFTGFTYAYLIEISNYTKALLTDRGKVWSATLQRIAHEIKTPLSGINLGLDTLKNRLSRETNNYSKDISLIQNEVNRIKALTKNFLIFSNMEKPNFTEINLNFLINESLAVFQNYFNSGIDLILGNTNYTIIGDFTQLKQLFHIVFENAIDACAGKGTLEIKITRNKSNVANPNDKSEMVKNNQGTNDLIKISIIDNGKGIPEDEIAKIFEPYFTTKKDGTGIGLAIAKKIVEDHKGKIEIESNLGVGTKVIIYIQTP